MYGMNHKGTTFLVAVSIRGDEAFLSTRFWIEATKTAVSHDIVRWARATDDPSYFLSLPRDQIFTLFVINRIQAIVTSMQFLRIPLDTFVEYLSKVMDAYGLTDAGIDITVTPAEAFVTWTIEVMGRLRAKNRCAFISPKLKSFRARCHEGGLHDELGFSPLQEVLLFVAELADSTVAGPPQDESAAACVCGRSVGAWETLSLSSAPRRVLCETCMRHIYSNPLTSDGSFARTGLCVTHELTSYTPSSFHSVFYDGPSEDDYFRFDLIERSGLLSVDGALAFLEPKPRQQLVNTSSHRGLMGRPSLLSLEGSHPFTVLYSMFKVGVELVKHIQLKQRGKG